MSKAAFVIQFPSPGTPDIMHRVLNYVEDLHVRLVDAGAGSVEDIDNYADGRFVVFASSKRDIGGVHSRLDKLLSRHKLGNLAVVERA